MNITKVPISKVKPWKDNPRYSKKKDYKRLLKQLTELGVYKPMIACAENGGYTVLGGNMRLRALQELGHKEVGLSVVKVFSEADKIKYALSDNDHIGTTDDQKAAELIYPHIEDIELEDYNIDIGESINIGRMLDDFAPGEVKEQARLDKLAEKEKVKCPECGCEFLP